MDGEWSVGIIPITDGEFGQISQLVYDEFGIHLTDQKKSLVISRLNKVLHQRGFRSFHDYYEFVVNDKTGEALKELVTKISTNHSYFYREKEHFEWLEKKVLPDIEARRLRTGENTLRIWSAGCASGEEVYTTAMVLREYFGKSISEWDIGLLATDISMKVLQNALLGEYEENRLRELPVPMRDRYFKSKGEHFVLTQEIKDMVLFKKLNLMDAQYPFRGQFDVVFCRNVMIYFDQPTREALVNRFYQVVRPEGWLFIGHSESLSQTRTPFAYVRPAIYRKAGGTHV